jgi:hypothetical protein
MTKVIENEKQGGLSERSKALLKERGGLYALPWGCRIAWLKGENVLRVWISVIDLNCYNDTIFTVTLNIILFNGDVFQPSCH